ncbi:hypothetical protein FV228_15750 [Methylobacterium sp. WL18]|uniref:hypothetical protein n=1 Tax=Methylobacterium sp. WL18 TaxID=2603897 RepID=UPI0011CCBAFB|nr:hypothetical protein [Methylobacterium sp. WL18]TXN65408.1 hypothetical protein FV228_15750 [Methylobacterium sp. WL18]
MITLQEAGANMNQAVQQDGTIFDNFVARWAPFLKIRRSGLKCQSVSSEELNLLDKIAQLEVHTILDVGANDGKYAAVCLNKFTMAKIHSFEVNPLLNKYLSARSLSDRFILNEFGLSNKDGSRLLEYDPIDPQASLLIHGNVPRGGKWEKTIVKELSGDAYCEKNSIKSIDILNLNTGHENNLVLEGLKGKLAVGEIHIVRLKYHLSTSDHSDNLSKIAVVLSKHNFALSTISNRGINFEQPINFNSLPNGIHTFIAVHKSRENTIALLGK